MANTLVPDTSVLIDGRISELLTGDYDGADVVVPHAAVAELEAQANRGQETGFTGLDELRRLHEMASEGRCTVRFEGRRPTVDEVERADAGAVDALIRQVAAESGATLVTADRVQNHAAAAEGLAHLYLAPHVDDPALESLRIWPFFDAETMSVHLKADCVPMVKRGTPGAIVYEPHGDEEITHQEIRKIARECIEFAKRDYQSFIEMQRHGCTVVQLGPMRITIAQPPFSDGLEITAVRPVIKAHLDDYDLPDTVRERIEGRAKGVFVAGPPGSGKSTFAAAVAEHLHGMNRVVKTMEAPRDLQVPKEITQYAPLDHDMAWTGEVMLLVRPDHVVYDEVRTTNDYRVFADMRLAGIGLFGVTHANRAIDAVQRLLGRVDLGMIPQVVDTVVFIEAGRIEQILEISFTVRTPAGMTQEDLARPVVVVKDFDTGEEKYELYTYGEQIVVMPLEDAPATARNTGTAGLAEKEVFRTLKRYVRGPLEVQMRGSGAVIRVEEHEIPSLIGKGGRTVQGLERRLGIRLDIQGLEPQASRQDRHDRSDRGERGRDKPTRATIRIKRTGSIVFVMMRNYDAGAPYDVFVEGSLVGTATASKDGKLRFKANSHEGQALTAAEKAGADVTATKAVDA